MCYGCWEKEGKPMVLNDAVREAAAAIEGVYAFSSVGGNAHVSLDDWNLDNGNLEFCLNKAIPKNVHGSSEQALQVEAECLRMLLKMTLAERYSALALYEGIFHEVNGKPFLPAD